MSDSDELFSLRQEFFTGKYTSVAEASVDEYTPEAQPYVISYKIRSLLKLGKSSEVPDVLSQHTGNDSFNKAFELYTQFYKSQSESPEFDQLIESLKNEWYVQQVGSLYLVALNRIEEAITLLQHHSNSLESVLYLISLYLCTSRLDLAEKELATAANYSQDSIIYNISEALVNSVKNGEGLRGVLYFYEELGHQYPSLKTKLGHFIINLQLKQFEEAEVTLTELEDLGLESADLIANQITLASLKGDDARVDELRNQLAVIEPQHQLLVDYQEKSKLFSDIVEKYAAQAQN